MVDGKHPVCSQTEYLHADGVWRTEKPEQELVSANKGIMDFNEWKQALIAKNSKIGDYIGGICNDTLVSFWNQNYSQEDVLLFLESGELVTDNRLALKKAYHCGCCNCLEIFDPKEIKWADEDDAVICSLAGANTAVCPHCGVDCIVPNCTLEQLENIRRVRLSEALPWL